MKKISIGAFILYFLLFSLVLSYLNPNLSIRRHILFSNPIASFSAKISSQSQNDKQYGHCYTIQGDWKDLVTQNPLGNVCIKREFIIYYVTAQGFG